MPASINDKIIQAENGGNPQPTTVSSPRSIGGTSLSCVALTNWPTATAVHLITYKKKADGTMDRTTLCLWKGIVSGTTIGTLTLKGGTDAGNVVGDFVEAAPTSAQWQDLVDGLLKEHNTDGTHGDVTADSLTVSGTVTLPAASITPNALADGAVGPSKLSLNPTTNFSGGAQTISSGTYSGSSPATDVVVGKNGILLVLIGAHFDTNTDQECSMSFKLSGSNTVAASSSNAASSKTQSQKTDSRISSFALLTGLNPGTTTITAQFAIFGGSGSSSVSSISVAGIPF